MAITKAKIKKHLQWQRDLASSLRHLEKYSTPVPSEEVDDLE